MRTLFSLFLTALVSHAQVLTASKILAGSGTDLTSAVASDSQGNVFLAGTTTSPDFPLVNALYSGLPETALRLSTDGGKTFSAAALPVPAISAIAATSDGQTVIAANGGNVYRSADAGATWSSLATLPNSVSALAFDASNPLMIYAVTAQQAGSSFYRSSDGGQTWQALANLGPAASGELSRLFVRSSTDIYAMFYGALFGLYHTTDGGVTWQSPDFPGNGLLLAFAVAPSDQQTFYAVPISGPAQKSADGGATWQSIAGLSPEGLNDLAVDPNDPDTIWIGGYNGIQRSTDGGETVQSVYDPSGVAWQSIAVDPTNSSQIFAASGTQFFASFDDGATWNPVATGQYTLTLPTPAAIFAAGSATPTLYLAKLDPGLDSILFSTLLGPVRSTAGIALTLDSAGNPLLTGATSSPDFPITAGALQSTPSAANGGFAVKLRADGSALLYSTFLGFVPASAAFDSAADAVIVGTAQPGAAVTPGAFQATLPAACARARVGLNIIPPSQSGHAYAAKLNAAGNGLIWSTYFSGACGDSATAVQLDAAGNAYITGYTLSVDFPVTANAFTSSFNTNLVYSEGFVSELSSVGSRLIYSSYFGGGENNSGSAIALDSRGNLYVAGSTQASASPGALAVLNPGGCAYQISIGPAIDESYEYVDGFVMKLPLNGASPTFLATVGGSCHDGVGSLALDTAGNIWVAGTTASQDFPTRAPIGALGVGQGGFVAEIDPSGANLLFSSFTGGGSNYPSPTVSGSKTGVYLASTISQTSKAGAVSALVAFIDGSQTVPVALDSIQIPSIVAPTEEPFFGPPSVAPGTLLLLNGSNLGPSTPALAKLTSAGAFPMSLAGVQVTFNGVAAPLISVGQSQIECQAPFELDGQISALIQVESNGQASNSYAAAVSAQQLSLLAVVNPDGTANSASNPAPIGAVATLYLTGIGQTTPNGVTGTLNAGAAIAARTGASFYVNGEAVQPAFFGAAPGESTGVFQLNVPLPPPVNPGFDSLSVSGNAGGPLDFIGVRIYVK